MSLVGKKAFLFTALVPSLHLFCKLSSNTIKKIKIQYLNLVKFAAVRVRVMSCCSGIQFKFPVYLYHLNLRKTCEVQNAPPLEKW